MPASQIRAHRARTIRHCLLDALTISLARDADPINATECLISVPVRLRSLDRNPSNAGLSKVCLGPSSWRALNHDTLAARNQPRTSSRFGCGVCRIGLRREPRIERMARMGSQDTELKNSEVDMANLARSLTQHAEDNVRRSNERWPTQRSRSYDLYVSRDKRHKIFYRVFLVSVQGRDFMRRPTKSPFHHPAMQGYTPN
jgi:hypothetical protein